jgi:RNA polymerase sigma-70 factor (ECF subfamily)
LFVKKTLAIVSSPAQFATNGAKLHSVKDRFLHIVAQHQGIIHKVCRIYRDTMEDREDLFQEIVYQLWKAFPSFKGEAQPSTWMYKIALSTAVARYRKRHHRLHQQKVPIEKASYVLEREEEETSEQKDRLYRAIGTHSPAEKAIITLYLDDYNYVEMADIIGISENYIGVKLNRIKEKLRKLLK